MSTNERSPPPPLFSSSDGVQYIGYEIRTPKNQCICGSTFNYYVHLYNASSKTKKARIDYIVFDQNQKQIKQDAYTTFIRPHSYGGGFLNFVASKIPLGYILIFLINNGEIGGTIICDPIFAYEERPHFQLLNRETAFLQPECENIIGKDIPYEVTIKNIGCAGSCYIEIGKHDENFIFTPIDNTEHYNFGRNETRIISGSVTVNDPDGYEEFSLRINTTNGVENDGKLSTGIDYTDYNWNIEDDFNFGVMAFEEDLSVKASIDLRIIDDESKIYAENKVTLSAGVTGFGHGCIEKSINYNVYDSSNNLVKKDVFRTIFSCNGENKINFDDTLPSERGYYSFEFVIPDDISFYNTPIIFRLNNILIRSPTFKILSDDVEILTKPEDMAYGNELKLKIPVKNIGDYNGKCILKLKVGNDLIDTIEKTINISDIEYFEYSFNLVYLGNIQFSCEIEKYADNSYKSENLMILEPDSELTLGSEVNIIESDNGLFVDEPMTLSVKVSNFGVKTGTGHILFETYDQYHKYSDKQEITVAKLEEKECIFEFIPKVAFNYTFTFKLIEKGEVVYANDIIVKYPVTWTSTMIKQREYDYKNGLLGQIIEDNVVNTYDNEDNQEYRDYINIVRSSTNLDSIVDKYTIETNEDNENDELYDYNYIISDNDEQINQNILDTTLNQVSTSGIETSQPVTVETNNGNNQIIYTGIVVGIGGILLLGLLSKK